MATATEGRLNGASYYDGSRRFLWISEKTGLPLDQLNFAVIQVFALLMAFVLRYHLHPTLVTPTRRHIFSALIGLYMIYFCHGRETIHVILLAVICYILLKTTSPYYFQRIVLIVALSYLSCIQILRVKYFYGSYILDVTGPMMLATQKVTSLAYGLHDGLSKSDEKLSPSQKKLAVRNIPSTIEFFSYMFHFQTVLCGPLAMYSDYIKFIEGWHHSSLDKHYNFFDEKECKVAPEPSSVNAVLRKLLAAILFGVLVLAVTPVFPLHQLKDPEFVMFTSLPIQIWTLIITTTIARFKYYHAWLIADAIANASGFGFNGYTSNGIPKWDLISNVDVLGFEFSISFRESLENWNKGTMRWLRYIVYDRAPYYKTLLTYTLSAIWHGFYPGYYLTFGSAALVTIASRCVRHVVRPHFMKNFWSMTFYHFLTFLVTKIGIAYVIFPFLLLELEASINLYKHMNFYFHAACFLAIYLLPFIIPNEHEEKPKNDDAVDEQKQQVSVNKSVHTNGNLHIDYTHHNGNTKTD